MNGAKRWEGDEHAERSGCGKKKLLIKCENGACVGDGLDENGMSLNSAVIRKV